MVEQPTNDWRDEALCTLVDPELFYPDQGGSPRLAKAICQQCPVRQECLAWAQEHGERYGVWGGLTAWERRPVELKRLAEGAA